MSGIHQARSHFRFLANVCVFLETACSLCREGKKKCSGTVPCTQCIRRKRPQECQVTYLSRGSRPKVQQKNSGAGRQNLSSSILQVPATDSEDTISLALPSPSNMGQSGSDSGVVGAAGPVGPLSPSASQDSYMTMNRTVASGTNGDNEVHDSSLITPGSRMLLSSHGERGTRDLFHADKSSQLTFQFTLVLRRQSHSCKLSERSLLDKSDHQASLTALTVRRCWKLKLHNPQRILELLR